MEVDKSYSQVILTSQDHWRSHRRGIKIISQPVELPPVVTGWIDQGLKTFFQSYIEQDRPRMIISWSILTDDTPTSLLYDQVLPKGLEGLEGKEQAYYRGIHDLNEWATQLATRDYFNHLTKGAGIATPLLKVLEIIRNVPLFTSPSSVKAGDLMKEVQNRSGSSPEQFRDSVYMALFRHRFEALNRLVKASDMFGCQDLHELAVLLGESKTGRSYFKKFIDWQISGDLPGKRMVERLKRSFFIAGNMTDDGVVGIYNGIFALPCIIVAINRILFDETPLDNLITNSLLYLSMTGVITPRTAIHETIHGYSTSKNFLGLIRIKRQSRVNI